jgi:hypothetical protein
MNQEFQKILKATGTPPALHPVLAVLSIVLKTDDDLGNIKRFHPQLEKHCYYKAEAEFPNDLSDHLPGATQRWWEHLGKS